MKKILLPTYLESEKLFPNSREKISGASFDSRLTKKGDLFFALTGEKTDGHYYLLEASQNGAVAAVVCEKYQGPDFGLELHKVDSVIKFLQHIAKALVKLRQPQIVGITGSIGKTTTKEFATALIQGSYHVFSTPKSYNSQITLPISILNAKGDEEIYILEMAMSEPGNLSSLISIAPPSIAMITTIALQHANQFSDGIIGIAKEKASIFSHPQTKIGFLHQEVPHRELISSVGAFEKVLFSLEDPQAEYYLKMEGDCFEVFFQKKSCLRLPLLFPIRPFYHNFLCAVILARTSGVSWELIANRALMLTLPPMRFEKIVLKGITFINDAYNANPDSIKAALEGIPQPQQGGRKIAVLSEMNALGMYSESAHAFIGELAQQHVDLLFCIGDRCNIIQKSWKKEKNTFEIFKTKESLKQALEKKIKPGDVVLIKGARSYALETLIKEFGQ